MRIIYNRRCTSGKWEIKTRTEENGKAILPDVAETILKKWRKKELRKQKLPVWV